MSENYSKSQKRTILSLSVITVLLSFLWFAKENWQLEKHLIFLQGWGWFENLNVEPLVTFFASSIPVVTLYWPFRARYTSTRIKDSIVIDMHNSNRIEIGKGAYKFTAELANNSMTSQHLIVERHPSTPFSGIAGNANYFEDIKDVTSYHLTDGNKSPNVDDVIILKNRYGRYALLIIKEITESTGNTKGILVKIDYVINSKNSVNFS